ncbi:MAG: YdbL family protein [Kiritimatiellae bacterium]|nr:YdbL family protein [Kiritimatiellia bacterium]
MKLAKKAAMLAAATAAIAGAGCIKVQTESEIKPIHITMDVNLKVDKELDKAFGGQERGEGGSSFKAVREMVGRGAAGMTNRAMLEERENASDADRILIAEENARRVRRFSEIAKSSGTTLEAVQKRYAARMLEKIAAGTWYQDETGAWLRK